LPGSQIHLVFSFLLSVLTQLEHHVKHNISGQATFRTFGPMADCTENGFDGVAGPDALPLSGMQAALPGKEYFAKKSKKAINSSLSFCKQSVALGYLAS
jgi:hypothetical protein